MHSSIPGLAQPSSDEHLRPDTARAALVSAARAAVSAWRLAKGLLQAGSPGGDPRTQPRSGEGNGRSIWLRRPEARRRSARLMSPIRTSVDRGIADIEQEWGTPDILVNNAGIQRRAPVHRVHACRTGMTSSPPT